MPWYWWLVLVVVIVGGMYGLTVAKGPVGYADSDDLIDASAQMGLAHPPGYPILTLVSGSLMKLIAVEPAKVANTIAWALMTTTVGLLFLCGWEAAYQERKNVGLIQLGLFIGVLWWASRPWIWFQSRVFEVMPAAMAIVALIGYLGLRGRRVEGKQRQQLVFGMALLAGLGLHVHQLVGLVSLPILLLTSRLLPGWRAKVKVGVAFLGSFGIAFGAYWLVSTKGGYSWPITLTAKGLWQQWWRLGYNVNGSAIETMAGWGKISAGWRSVQQAIVFELGDWGMVGLILLTLGSIGFWWKERRMAAVSLLLWLVAGMGIIWYLKLPGTQNGETEYFWGTMLRWRMLFGAMVTEGLVVVIGVPALIGNFGKSVKWQKRWVVMGMSVLGLMVGGRILTSFRQMKQLPMQTDEILVQNTLLSLPKNSVLVVADDWIFAFLYQRVVLTWRPDITIIGLNVPLTSSKGRVISWPGYLATYQDPDQFGSQLIAWLLTNHEHVYVWGAGQHLLELLGVEGNPFFADPQGLYLRISRLPPTQVTDTIGTALTDKLEKPSQQWWYRGLASYVADQEAMSMYFFVRGGIFDAAERLYQEASSLYVLPESRERLDQLRQKARLIFTDQNSYWVYEVPAAADYEARGKAAFETKDFASAGYYFSRALLIDPSLMTARQALVRTWQAEGNSAEAEHEQQRLVLVEQGER